MATRLAAARAASRMEGPIKIYNNLIAGSSESWIFGGGFAVAWPHYYEIRRNLSMKPLKWMMALRVGVVGESPNVKNLASNKHVLHL